MQGGDPKSRLASNEPAITAMTIITDDHHHCHGVVEVEVDGSRIENWVVVDVQSFRSGPLNCRSLIVRGIVPIPLFFKLLRRSLDIYSTSSEKFPQLTGRYGIEFLRYAATWHIEELRRRSSSSSARVTHFRVSRRSTTATATYKTPAPWRPQNGHPTTHIPGGNALWLPTH